jgi:hypothetical protein
MSNLININKTRKSFLDTFLALSNLNFDIEELVDGITQEKIDELSKSLLIFDNQYTMLKLVVGQLIKESVNPDSDEISGTPTDKGVEL